MELVAPVTVLSAGVDRCWFGKRTGVYTDYIYQGPMILVLVVSCFLHSFGEMPPKSGSPLINVQANEPFGNTIAGRILFRQE